MELELWARLKPSKRKFQIWLFRDFKVDTPNFDFLPAVPRVSRPPGARKSTSIAIRTFLKQVLFQFLKNIFDQILVEQRKSDVLLKEKN
jgi:hypothetical protein